MIDKLIDGLVKLQTNASVFFFLFYFSSWFFGKNLISVILIRFQSTFLEPVAQLGHAVITSYCYIMIMLLSQSFTWVALLDCRCSITLYFLFITKRERIPWEFSDFPGIFIQNPKIRECNFEINWSIKNVNKYIANCIL